MSTISHIFAGLLAVATGTIFYTNHQKQIRHEEVVENTKNLSEAIQEMRYNCTNENECMGELLKFAEYLKRKEEFNNLKKNNILSKEENNL
ncbi:hypothetical protein M0813_20727 [Anaeramoeba flamelloides]|uniref:Uncharacterized protein n=1 Tax=Anaeramoeba flamelloides TaxID=1746091 RepID=A0ABQ8YKB0_9EUKA|nr:hypothetical protein M0813_20727 [Anaeramoeba flamelloides]